ncbi:unnamed protein product [Closterium sp. NIES-54]
MLGFHCCFPFPISPPLPHVLPSPTHRYAQQVVTPELNALVAELLAELVRFQVRALQKDPIKVCCGIRHHSPPPPLFPSHSPRSTSPLPLPKSILPALPLLPLPCVGGGEGGGQAGKAKSDSFSLLPPPPGGGGGEGGRGGGGGGGGIDEVSHAGEGGRTWGKRCKLKVIPPLPPTPIQLNPPCTGSYAAACAIRAEGGGAGGHGSRRFSMFPHIRVQGAMRRRILARLKEVGQAVCSGRAKCVVLAPNVEEVSGAGEGWGVGGDGNTGVYGGLDAALSSILLDAATRSIPMVVALSRRHLTKGAQAAQEHAGGGGAGEGSYGMRGRKKLRHE